MMRIFPIASVSHRNGNAPCFASHRRRVLRFETLESRRLLSASQGITSAEWADITGRFPGFDFSGITAAETYVIDSDQISAASLKNAIAAAKTHAGSDMIVIRTNDAANTLTFTKSDDMLTIDDASPLILLACGANPLTVNAAGHSRIFSITARSDVQMGNMVLTGGTADNGGAIYSAGRLTFDQMRVSGNSALGEGGGLYALNVLGLYNSVVSGNKAGGNGGGIFLGGVFTSGAGVSHHIMVNNTITGNTAGFDGNGKGGGLYFVGQDTDYNIFADINLYNCIVVQNHSSATSIDTNIYNDLFYNKVTFGDETYEFEIPISALIDGNNNLTTFTYWVSWYNPDAPSQVGSNQVYNESAPLFVRYYDFSTNTEGDYTLIESDLSQSINLGGNNYAVYRNSARMSCDLSGNRRIRDRIDIGAYEMVSTCIDLKTGGGILSCNKTVLDGHFQINGIVLTNNSGISANNLTIHFFASNDKTIEETDILIGEMEVAFLSENERRTLDSCFLKTSSLFAGQSYYIGWTVDVTNDIDMTNNVAVCQTPLTLFGETDAVQTVELEQSSYHVQQGCAFYLTAPNQPSETAQYWWDYGNGYYTLGAYSECVDAAQYNPTPGQYEIRLKIVDEKTGLVVQKASSSLTVTKTAPCFEVVKTSFLNGRILKLDIDVHSYGPLANNWIIDWGDGSGPITYNSLSASLSAVHCYAVPNRTTTHSITLKTSAGQYAGGSKVYLIGYHTLNAFGAKSQEGIAAAAEAPVSAEKNDSTPRIDQPAPTKEAVFSKFTQATKRFDTTAFPDTVHQPVINRPVAADSVKDAQLSFFTSLPCQAASDSPRRFSVVLDETPLSETAVDRLFENQEWTRFEEMSLDIGDLISDGLNL